jgi:hypothetical protein
MKGGRDVKIFNATSKTSKLPQAAMLNNGIMWPDTPIEQRTALPSAERIFDAIRAAPARPAFYFIDDAQALGDALTAALMHRVSEKTGRPVTVYNATNSVVEARNLLRADAVNISDATWAFAVSYASAPVWSPRAGGKLKPLGYYAASLCPSLYVDENVSQYADLRDGELSRILAWRLVAEHAISAARYCSTLLGGKPIYPFVHLPAAFEEIKPSDILTFLESRGVDGVVVWGESRMNEIL